MFPIKRTIAFILISLSSLLLQSCGGGSSNGPYPLALQTPPGDPTIEPVWSTYAFSDSNKGAQDIFAPVKLVAYGGSPDHGYTWTISSWVTAPIPGMVIDKQTGVVSGGVPPQSGWINVCDPAFPCGDSFIFNVTVSDGVSSVTAPFAVQVIYCDSSKLGCDALAGLEFNESFSDTFVAADQSTPASGSTTTIATDINFEPFAASVSGKTVPEDIPAGIPFGLSMSASGGTAPYKSWHIASGSPPPGLNLDPDTGTLYGTPEQKAVGQTYIFEVTASDSAGDFSPDVALKQVVNMQSITISGGSYQPVQ